MRNRYAVFDRDLYTASPLLTVDKSLPPLGAYLMRYSWVVNNNEGKLLDTDRAFVKHGMNALILQEKYTELSHAEIIDQAKTYQPTHADGLLLSKKFGEVIQNNQALNNFTKRNTAEDRAHSFSVVDTGIEVAGAFASKLSPKVAMISAPFKLGAALEGSYARRADLNTKYDLQQDQFVLDVVRSALPTELRHSLEKHPDFAKLYNPTNTQMNKALADLPDFPGKDIVGKVARGETVSQEELKSIDLSLLTKIQDKEIERKTKDLLAIPKGDSAQADAAIKLKAEYKKEKYRKMCLLANYGAQLGGMAMKVFTGDEERANAFTQAATFVVNLSLSAGMAFLSPDPYDKAIYAAQAVTSIVSGFMSYFSQDRNVDGQRVSAHQMLHFIIDMNQLEFIRIHEDHKLILLELSNITNSINQLRTAVARLDNRLEGFKNLYRDQEQEQAYINLYKHEQRLGYLLQTGLDKSEYHKHVLAFYQFATQTARTPVFSGFSRSISREALLEDISKYDLSSMFGLLQRIFQEIKQLGSSEEKAPPNSNSAGKNKESAELKSDFDDALARIDDRNLYRLPNPIAFMEGGLRFIQARIMRYDIRDVEFDQMLDEMLDLGLKLSGAIALFTSQEMANKVESFYQKAFQEEKGKIEKKLTAALTKEAKSFKGYTFNEWMKGFPLPSKDQVEKFKTTMKEYDRWQQVIKRFISTGNAKIFDGHDVYFENVITNNGDQGFAFYQGKKGSSPIDFAVSLGLISIEKSGKCGSQSTASCYLMNNYSISYSISKQKIHFMAEPFKGLSSVDVLVLDATIGGKYCVPIYDFNSNGVVSNLISQMNEKFLDANVPLVAVPTGIKENGNYKYNPADSITFLDLLLYQCSNLLFYRRIQFAKKLVRELSDSNLFAGLQKTINYCRLVDQMRDFAKIQFYNEVSISFDKGLDFISILFSRDYRSEDYYLADRQYKRSISNDEYTLEKIVALMKVGLASQFSSFQSDIQSWANDISQPIAVNFIDDINEKLYRLAQLFDIRLNLFRGMSVAEFQPVFSVDACQSLMQYYLDCWAQSRLQVSKSDCDSMGSLSSEAGSANAASSSGVVITSSVQKQIEITLSSINVLTTKFLLDKLNQPKGHVFFLGTNENVTAIYIPANANKIIYIDYASKQLPDVLISIKNIAPNEKGGTIEVTSLASQSAASKLPASAQFATLFMFSALREYVIDNRVLGIDYDPIGAFAEYRKILLRNQPPPQAGWQLRGYQYRRPIRQALKHSAVYMLYSGFLYAALYSKHPNLSFQRKLAITSLTSAMMTGQYLGAGAMAGQAITRFCRANNVALFTNKYIGDVMQSLSEKLGLTERGKFILQTSLLTAVFSSLLAVSSQKETKLSPMRSLYSSDLNGFSKFVFAQFALHFAASGLMNFFEESQQESTESYNEQLMV